MNDLTNRIQGVINNIRDATEIIRESNQKAEARQQAIASYEYDATHGKDDEWAYFDFSRSGDCLLEIWGALKLPPDEFKRRVEKSLLRLIERNAETNADILERNGRL